MSQDKFALLGNICYSTGPNKIHTIERGYLVVSGDKIVGAFDTLPDEYSGVRVEDYGEALIIPGMTDLHVHAPQFPFRGIGMDLELLDWLNTYTFPEEAKYSSIDYAEKIYEFFTQALKARGPSMPASSPPSTARQRTFCSKSWKKRACGHWSAKSIWIETLLTTSAKQQRLH